MPAANESIRVLWEVGSLSGGVLTSEAACEGDNFGARSGLVPVSGTIVVTGTTIASTCPVGNDYVVRATVQLVADGSVQSTVLVEDFPFAIRVPSPSVDAAFSPSDSEREGTAIDVVFSLRHLPTDPNNYGEMIYTLGVYSTTTSGGTPTLRHAHGCEGAGFANRAREALVSVPITPTAALETVAATISGRCPPGDYVVQFDVKSSPDFGALNPVVELIASGAFPFEIVGLTPTAAMRFSPADAAPSGSSIGLALTLTDLIETESGETLQLVWDVGTLAGEAFTANAVCRGAGSFGETTDLAPVSGTQAVTGTVSELCPHGSYVVRVGVQLDADGDVQALLTEDFDFTITRGTPSAGAVFGPSALEKAGTRIDVDFKLNHLPADAAAYGEMVYTLGVFTTTASGGNTDYHHVHECEGAGFANSAPDALVSVPITPTRSLETLAATVSRRCPPGDYVIRLVVASSQDFSDPNETTEEILSEDFVFEILELNPDADLVFSPSATVESGTPISLTLKLSDMPVKGANESIRVLWGVGRLSGGVLTPVAACEGDNFGARSGLVPISGIIFVTGATIASTCPIGDDYVVRASVDLEIDGSVQSSVLVADFPFAIDAPPPSFGAVFSPAESVNEWTSIDVALELRHLPTDAAEYGEMIYTLGIYSATTSMGNPTNHAYACEGAGFPNSARDALVNVPITPTMTLETVAATISWRCPPGDYVVQFDLKTSDDFSVLESDRRRYIQRAVGVRDRRFESGGGGGVLPVRLG